MSTWDATTFDARANLMRVLDRQAQNLFALTENPGAWEAPTACTHWRVRDIVGHLIDVTESYFTGFDAARTGSAAPGPLGVKVMQDKLNEGAQSMRELGQATATSRLREDYTKLQDIIGGLSAQDWTGLIVPHKYMGPLPAYFYPVFQLMDYGVHGWDIRQGSGRAHCLDGEAADLLVPFMFILWSATANPAPETSEIGIRITNGHSQGSWRVTAGPDGLSYAPGDAETTIEFDSGSFVLTAFGRSNAGTVRGDAAIADRFLNVFFRI